MGARALGMGLTRGFCYQFTTETIFVVKNRWEERFLTCWVSLGSGLWHNTAPDIGGALPQAAEGRLSCRSTRTSLSLCLTKPPVWPMRPFPKAIPISDQRAHSNRKVRFHSA